MAGDHSNPVQVICLSNAAGLEVELVDFGACIRSLRVPGKAGPVQAVLGYPDPEAYRDNPCYLGSTLGRYANRIENALLKGTKRDIRLKATPGAMGHCLHGGARGFSHTRWELQETTERHAARFNLRSPDGDQGFPGTLTASVTYRLLEPFTLRIEYSAQTDAQTVVNLANHAYFNLNGDRSPALDHELWIHADRYTPAGESLVPTGEIRELSGSRLDFRQPSLLASRLGPDTKGAPARRGIDVNYMLNGSPGELRHAATLVSPVSGLGLKLNTTQPCLQLYTGHYLADPFRPFDGICLEAQRPPNAPNIEGFPDATLEPGETYRQVTEYAFFQAASAS
jgi:aldose 1-epimerase